MRAPIAAGHDEQAAVGLDKLIAEHNDNPDLPAVLYNLAEDEIKRFIEAGDDSNALAAIDKLIADFNDQQGLSDTVFLIGEGYYERALGREEVVNYLGKAIAVWKRVINDLPVSGRTPQAHYLLADCYLRLGEYEKAVECCKEILANWPDYSHAAVARLIVERRVKEIHGVPYPKPYKAKN